MTETFETITSPANALIKCLRGLDRKKLRAETGLFLAEGARLIEQGLSRGWQAEAVVVSQSGADRGMNREIAARAHGAGARTIRVPDALMARLARKDNPQGSIAAFRQVHRGLDSLSAPPGEAGLWIALHTIRDPGNLGTILRTADCAGARGVILVDSCCDPYSVEAVRASMGSIFDMAFAAVDFETLETWRRAGGMRMVAASMNATRRHDRADFGPRTLLIMGNEQAGLPGEVEAACDVLARIPMRGGADSLNLAQASAIMLYEAWRARDFA
jgi:RNA methyltransferase, TrmH family